MNELYLIVRILNIIAFYVILWIGFYMFWFQRNSFDEVMDNGMLFAMIACAYFSIKKLNNEKN